LWRAQAAVLCARLGDAERAAQLIGEERALADRVNAPRTTGMVLRAAGLVAEDAEERMDLLAKAVDALRDSPSRLELARALVDQGAAMRRGGQRAAAREPLREGRELAHRFGASPLLELASEELKATGARPRRIMLSGIDSLTASERRVAQMAAEGLNNRQIAEALFVTRKAVEFHLGNTYSKLGIRSRAELPDALAEPQ
jgi:DNA-binding CsgD family transcriptional regulator